MKYFIVIVLFAVLIVGAVVLWNKFGKTDQQATPTASSEPITSQIKDTASDFFDAIGRELDEMDDNFGDTMDKALEKLTDAKKRLGDEYDTLSKKLGDGASDAKDAAAKKMTELNDRIKELEQKVRDKFKEEGEKDTDDEGEKL